MAGRTSAGRQSGNRVRTRGARAGRAGRARGLVRRPQGRDAGHCRGERVGQERHGASRSCALIAPPGRIVEGPGQPGRRGPAGPAGAADAGRARGADRDGLPGPDDRSEPDADRRASRSSETILAHQKVTRAEARAQALDWLTRVRVSLPRPPSASVPARAVRRDAPARHARHRLFLPSRKCCWPTSLPRPWT